MNLSRPLYVIDSSVAYKWFTDANEPHVVTALELLQGHRDGTLLLTAPAHMPVEVLKGLQSSGLDVVYLRRVPGLLSGAEVALAPANGALLAQALELALAYDLTIHDALFPALAIQLDCELVTADRAMATVTECPVRLLA